MDNHPIVAASLIDAESRLSRSRLWRLFATALGVGLGLGPSAPGRAADCRKKSSPCTRKKQCCSNRCKRGFCYPRRKKKKR